MSSFGRSRRRVDEPSQREEAAEDADPEDSAGAKDVIMCVCAHGSEVGVAVMDRLSGTVRARCADSVNYASILQLRTHGLLKWSSSCLLSLQLSVIQSSDADAKTVLGFQVWWAVEFA